ncbi:unnamed protein product [Ilex paraguariensis]|uniref:Uncharacterized protein n=1 Tax=Ilex paraguariensis TaxID=185542 RepID=A0ABC8RGS7_9AQUA
MAASSKCDLSSGSPDRPLYTTGQRGSYTGASLDRSCSFRENMENPILSTLPNMSRSSSAATQGDAVNFIQCLRFDPKLIVADHKLNRHGDFRQLTSVALGIPPDDSPASSLKGKLLPSPPPEELKRLKSGLRESSSKARERVGMLNEALSVINKCLPSVTSRKRSRSDVFASDRSNALFPSDRSVLGAGIGKIGAQCQAIATGFELEQQKPVERTKNSVPNRRTRTSMVDMRVDVRANTPARPSGNVDKDREMVRLPSSSALQCEDRTFGVDGWEKSKMKKKRSGIKPDGAASTLGMKPIDGYREPKEGIQPRLLPDGRLRLNDTHGSRPAIANEAVGVAKADNTLQQTGLGMRSSIPKADQDNNAFLNERRDHPTSSEKERVNLRAVGKTNAREDLSVGSPTSTTKVNASARAARSGSGVLPKFSPVVQRAAPANDWELSPCTSKLPAAVGANNRRRTPAARSSSPSVAQWAPQKNSRTARRTNFVPIVSSNDETPALGSIPDVGGNKSGSGYAKRFSGNSPQQGKLKGDHFSSTALSESEESGATEMKSKERGKKSDEMDEKAGQNIQKVSSLILPPRKNKVLNGDDLRDGVRRQGRTGRGFTSSRSLMPMTVEKLGNVGTAKQLRSARLGFDKTESKMGRPPTRKLSDRKAYKRQKHTTINAVADFLVGSDDGHEELLAAANAVINPALSFSSSFWRQMGSFFGFISDVDIAYLKQQGNLGSTATTPALVPFDVDSSGQVSNVFGLVDAGRDATETQSVELSPEYLALGMRVPLNEIPLYQRLIAALIPEEGNDELCSGNEDLKFDTYGSAFELDIDMESDAFNQQMVRGRELAGCAAANGYWTNINGKSFHELEHDMPEDIQDTTIISNFNHSKNGLLLERAMMPGIACSEYQYANMSLNERTILEVQSVGLHLEPVPDLPQTGDEEINRDISRLEEKYQEQVSKKKGLLGKLLKYASETREVQEKEFELRALEKLVAMGYEKYMSCWGPNASGGKSTSSKMAKQAALAFVKRTLERCHEFEETGKSCFRDPFFRDMFLSGSSLHNEAQAADAITDGESGKVNTSGCSMEVRTSASLGAQQSPSLNNHEVYSSAVLLSENLSSDHAPGKEDAWSTKKKKELLLDDVGGTISTLSGAPSGIRSSLSSSAKGKRSERDREGKGNSREVLSRNGTTKIGRPASGYVKGERKSKTKPKQKTTQLSASVNGLLGKVSEQPKTTMTSMKKSSETSARGMAKDKDDFNFDGLEDPIDLSNLQIPEMDVLGVPDDLGDQGQDLGSWLNFEEDGLQDHDFMGLEIPMDDLSDLKMMV